MAFEFHSDAETYYRHQYEHARNYIVPFIENNGFTLKKGLQVLEIGCGEGGVLKAFIEKGCIATGVDLSEYKLEKGKQLMESEIKSGSMRFILQDIYEVDFEQEMNGRFDLILMKDTIEHIVDQNRIIGYLKSFLKPGGHLYFGFPAWCMPFGGHQQICRSKWLSKLPYTHLLPDFLYKSLIRIAGESKETTEELLGLVKTGISTHRFETILEKNGYKIVKKTYFLINPIYKYKFGLNPKRLPLPLNAVPGLRDFLTTSAWYLIKPI
jgi:SAM-dependent methyltransferase